MQKIFRYNVIFKPEPEGGFTAIVPSLPGCVTYGRNLLEAKAMAHDAIEAYLFSLQKHGEKISSDGDDFVATVDVNIKKYSSRKLIYA